MFSLCACSLSASVCVLLHLCVCLASLLLVMWLNLKMRLEMNVQGKVKLVSFVCRYSFLGVYSSALGGLHAEVNSHNAHPMVAIIDLLSNPPRVDNFLSTVYSIHT